MKHHKEKVHHGKKNKDVRRKRKDSMRSDRSSSWKGDCDPKIYNRSMCEVVKAAAKHKEKTVELDALLNTKKRLCLEL